MDFFEHYLNVINEGKIFVNTANKFKKKFKLRKKKKDGGVNVKKKASGSTNPSAKNVKQKPDLKVSPGATTKRA